MWCGVCASSGSSLFFWSQFSFIHFFLGGAGMLRKEKKENEDIHHMSDSLIQGRCPKGDQPTDQPNDITTQPGVESHDTRLKMIDFLKRQKN